MKALKIKEPIQEEEEDNASESILMTILRLLTVEEINHMITMSSSEKKQSLTEMLTQELESIAQLKNQVGHTANILEFKQATPPEEEEKKEEAERSEESAETEGPQEQIADEITTEQSSNKRTIFEPEEEVVVEEKIDNTTFILDELRRFKESKKKLQEREIWQLYHKSASVSVEQQRNINDLAKSACNGILINKKQK